MSMIAQKIYVATDLLNGNNKCIERGYTHREVESAYNGADFIIHHDFPSGASCP